MNKQGCYREFTYAVVDDSSWGYHNEKAICGEGQLCDTCYGSKNSRESREKEMAEEKKTLFCGQQEGLEICQVKDGQEYQCYNCRKKELAKKK